MDNRKYIGMDVHQASISIAVSDAAGKVLIECIIETKAAAVLEFFQGLRRQLVGNLRGRDQCSLAVRLAEAARGQSGRMRSARQSKSSAPHRKRPHRFFRGLRPFFGLSNCASMLSSRSKYLPSNPPHPLPVRLAL